MHPSATQAVWPTQVMKVGQWDLNLYISIDFQSNSSKNLLMPRALYNAERAWWDENDEKSNLNVIVWKRKDSLLSDQECQESNLRDEQRGYFWSYEPCVELCKMGPLYMGHIPQDGDFGQNVAFFWKKVEPSCD